VKEEKAQRAKSRESTHGKLPVTQSPCGIRLSSRADCDNMCEVMTTKKGPRVSVAESFLRLLYVKMVDGSHDSVSSLSGGEIM
jgi:hypothetical protein